MIAEDSNDLKFVPLEKATTPPPDLICHIKDHYWIIHPKKGVVYWVRNKAMSPQANTNKVLAERFKQDMYPWAEVRLIPSVFHPINPQDYC